MIYYLFFPLQRHSPLLGVLNVLRYVPFRVIAAALTALLLTFLLSPWFIRRLTARNIASGGREDTPERHQDKAGTPTMGGSLILFAVVISTVLWADPRNVFVWLALGVTVGYGILGLIDDISKLRNPGKGGLKPRYKLLGQFLVGGLVVGYLFYGDVGLPAEWMQFRDRLSVPFLAFRRYPIHLPPLLYGGFATLVIVFASNAVNLTDGLDGLAIGPVIINAATYIVLAYLAGATFRRFSIAAYLDIPPIASAGELAVLCGSMVGAGIGFLWYNTYPAQLFMGDVGSLSLGGAIGTIAVLTKNELLAAILGGIFVLEAVSVITQVASFKLTGKRIFRMAPIHHHYELKGWAEPKIIVRFWIISFMLALVALASLKLR